MERHSPSAASYPQMALELSRVVACSTVLASGGVVEHAPTIPMPRVQEVVCHALVSHTMGTHRSVTLETLSSLLHVVVQEALNEEAGVGEARVDQLRDVLRCVRDGSVLRALRQVWDSTPAVAGSVDESVAAFSARGWDGLELSWSVITLETHRHVNLVWHQANKLERTFPDRESSDLFGWGWMGLRAALRLYDPSMGFAFSTYACTRITGSIRDGVRSENPVPKRLATYARKVVKAEEDLTQSLGRQPSLDEVANHLGEDLENLRIMPRLSPAASIDEMLDMASERGGVPRWLVDSGDPADLALSSARADAVGHALSGLPEDQRAAVQLLIMEALSPTEARSITGATARQMRQRKEKALLALRDSLSAWAE